MAKQIIQVNSIEEKTGKNNSKYFLVKTNKGTMSCFPDYSGLVELKQAFVDGKEIEVNVEQSGDFLNIRNEKKGTSPQATSNGRKEYDKDPVGLVVEIFQSIYEHSDHKGSMSQMELAIDLVKQAQKAFS